MSDRRKILILGGTREAADLAASLVKDGHAVTTSLAGRTNDPAPLAGEIRAGGFSSDDKSGAEGLADYLGSNGFDLLIDATHPFARQISRNAAEAARLTGIEFESRQRQPWQQQDGDKWKVVNSLEEACDAIPQNARVLLALGSQHIAAFASREDVFFLVRMVDAPPSPLPLKHHELLLGRPGVTPQQETDILAAHAITHIVCRNSGGTGAYAKIEAARNLGLPVIIIRQA